MPSQAKRVFCGLSLLCLIGTAVTSLLGLLGGLFWLFDLFAHFRAFTSLLENGRLINSQRGFGIQSSWPAGLWPLSIPIDHAVHGQALTTVERFVGPFLGSDHRPLHLRIGRALD